MKLSLDIRTSLTQTLTPQQIQYLKLLQMPVSELEQYIDQEIEQNPMLENTESPDIESADIHSGDADDDDFSVSNTEFVSPIDFKEDFNPVEITNFSSPDDDYLSIKDQIDDERDPFEFHDLIWQDDSEIYPADGGFNEDEDNIPFQIKDVVTFAEELQNQLSLLRLSEEELVMGRYIVGNLDDDGYLRRELKEVVDEANSFIAEHNFNIQHKDYLIKMKEKEAKSYNPAWQYSLSEESKKQLEYADLLNNADDISEVMPKKSQIFKNGIVLNGILKQINLQLAERILSIIRHLDPPGIGSRNMQECLVAQLEFITSPNEMQRLAMEILHSSYDAFTKKHYDALMTRHCISKDELKEVLEVIKKLNPKPGGGDSHSESNTVIPDFIVEREEDTNELMISLNDSRMPSIRVSKAYEALKRDAKIKKYNKETKSWIRQKHEDAKFLIQAIKQRKGTMLKVMTAITALQKDFFIVGKSGLKPLIYKDVAEKTALDISTICRIVNNKYVLSEYGTYELKYFFSEALPNSEGDDISTTIIKDALKVIISLESKDNPYSDDLLGKMLKEQGYNVARRTVAKYREQMRIPVARLRKEL
jgi:RNA polymerase sigma-54 factor